MALSGTINVTTNNQYIIGTLAWSAVQSISGNYSDVTATLRLWRTNDYTTSGSGTWTINIGGVTDSVSKSVSISLNSNTLIHTFTTRVYHNSDGTKSITISCSGGIPSTSYTSTTGSGTASLTTIPRATTVSVPTSADMATNITVSHSGVSTFTHKLYYTFGALNKVLFASPVAGATSTIFNPATATFAPQIPSSTSGVCTITCETYNGATLIGTTTDTITLGVPSSVKPTVGGVTPTESITSVGTVMGTGRYVKTLSNILFTVTGATGVYGSTITSCSINFNSANYTATKSGSNYLWNSGILGISGTFTATATVTDSRSRISTGVGVSVTILDYTPPNIATFTAIRTDNLGVPNEVGDYVTIVREGTATSLINSTEKNRISATVQYRERPSGAWVTANTVAENINVGTAVNATPIILDRNGATAGGGFDITKAYDFQFNLTDKFNTTISVLNVPTGTTVMSWSDTGVGIGKVWEQGALDVKGDAYIDGNLMDANSIKYQKKYEGQVYDYNQALTQGEYMSATSLVNAPLGSPTLYGKLIVIVSDGGTHDNSSNWIWQFLYLTNGDTWTRYKVNGGSWTTWEKSARTIGGSVYSDSGFACENQYAKVELGSKSAVGTPYIDLHTSGTDIDYDLRIVANSSGLNFLKSGGVYLGILGTDGVFSIGGYDNTNYTAFDVLREVVSIDGRARYGVNNADSTPVAGTELWQGGILKSYTHLGATYFRPMNNVLDLGHASYKWKTVYAVTGTINTSDRREKEEILPIPDAVLDAWADVNYCQFKFKDSVEEKGIDNARIHMGIIAQEIHEVFTAHGLDAFRYGLLCYDEWDDQYNEYGMLENPKGNMFSIRADECQFLEMALQRRETGLLKAKIAQLEAMLG